MNKKVLLIATLALSSLALTNAMATEYTKLNIPLMSTSDNYSVEITAGPHAKIDYHDAKGVVVSNHNFDHRAEATLTVVDNNSMTICRYNVSLMSGAQEAVHKVKNYHNGLQVQFNNNGQCLAAGNNGSGSFTAGNVSTGADSNGDSTIVLKVFPKIS